MVKHLDGEQPKDLTRTDSHINFEPEHEKPLFHMIQPGRRALGEDWTEVKIGHDGTDWTVRAEPTEAPADGRAVIVPSGGELEVEQTSFVIEWQAERARQRLAAKDPLAFDREKVDVNNIWHDYVEAKLKGLQGTTMSARGFFSQRNGIRSI